jgi:hypothetical protein
VATARLRSRLLDEISISLGVWIALRLTEVSADALVLPIISMRLQIYRAADLP